MKLREAATALVRHHLDAAQVHPCDANNDDVRALACIVEVQNLRAALSEPVAPYILQAPAIVMRNPERQSSRQEHLPAGTPLYTRPAAAPAERGELPSTIVDYPPLPEPAGQTHGDVFGHDNEPLFTADQMRAYVDADRAQRVPLTDLNQLPGRDWCTDPDNCQRCKAATWDQKKYHHAGIPLSGIGAKP